MRLRGKSVGGNTGTTLGQQRLIAFQHAADVEFDPGSSVSHFSTDTKPNQLMEPSINADLTHEVKPPRDLTYPLLRDIGW